MHQLTEEGNDIHEQFTELREAFGETMDVGQQLELVCGMSWCVVEYTRLLMHKIGLMTAEIAQQREDAPPKD